MSEIRELNEGWVARLQRGDAVAARHLYDQYSGAMYNTLIRIIGNKEDAKDILQESFITAFTSIEDLQKVSAFGGWLKRITINKGVEYVRKQKMNFQEVDENVADEPDEIDPDITMDELSQKINEIPNGCRQVFTLYLLEGYTHTEVAAMLNISVSTSKSQYHRAKKILRDSLKTVVA